MALKIRLRRQGRTNRPFYRLVVADSRSPADGKYVETIGWYNPLAHNEESELQVLPDRADYWLSMGAEPTDKAIALVKKAAPAVVAKHEEKALARRTKDAAKRKKRRQEAKTK